MANKFDVSAFLDKFDTGNVYNAQDMVEILRGMDKDAEHIMADLLEAHMDTYNELTKKLHTVTHKRPKRGNKKR